MKLFPKIFDIEVKGDIALPEIFHFEKGGVDLPVEIIKDENFPKVLALIVYFFEQISLLFDEVGWIIAGFHVLMIRVIIKTIQMIRNKSEVLSLIGCPCFSLFLLLLQLLYDLILIFWSKILSFLCTNFPLFPSNGIVFEPWDSFVFLFGASFGKVVFDEILDCISESGVFGKKGLFYWNFLQYLLNIWLVKEIHVHIFRANTVYLIDLLLQLRQLIFAFQYKHDFKTIFLRRSQEDQTPKISNILGVIGEVGVELEIKIDIEIYGADNSEAIGISFLVDDEQTWTILLPFLLINMYEHFGSGDKEDNSIIFAESLL